MNERIKALREALDLSQEAFGKEIGLVKSSVNENWLRTGAGDMFNPMSEDEELDLYIGRISGSDDNFKRNLLKALCKLTEDEWDVLKKIISEMKDG